MHAYLKKHVWGIPELTPAREIAFLGAAVGFSFLDAFLQAVGEHPSSAHIGALATNLFFGVWVGSLILAFGVGFISFDDRHEPFLSALPLRPSRVWLAHTLHGLGFVLLLGIALTWIRSSEESVVVSVVRGPQVLPTTLVLSTLAYSVGAFARLVVRPRFLSVLFAVLLGGSLSSVYAMISSPMGMRLWPGIETWSGIALGASVLFLLGSFALTRAHPVHWMLRAGVLGAALAIFGLGTFENVWKWKELDEQHMSASEVKHLGGGVYFVSLSDPRSGSHGYLVRPLDESCTKLGRGTTAEVTLDGRLLLRERFDEYDLFPKRSSRKVYDAAPLRQRTPDSWIYSGIFQTGSLRRVQTASDGYFSAEENEVYWTNLASETTRLYVQLDEIISFSPWSGRQALIKSYDSLKKSWCYFVKDPDVPLREVFCDPAEADLQWVDEHTLLVSTRSWIRLIDDHGTKIKDVETDRFPALCGIGGQRK